MEQSMEQNVVELQPFTIYGLGVDCAGYDFSGVGDLWTRLVERKGELPSGGRSIGLSIPRENGAYYIAGFEVPAGTPLPDGMESAEIASGQYYRLHFHDHPSQLPVAFGRIYRELIPAAGLKPRQAGPCFEDYPADFHDEAAGKFKMDLYAPLG